MCPKVIILDLILAYRQRISFMVHEQIYIYIYIYKYIVGGSFYVSCTLDTRLDVIGQRLV